MEKLNYVSLLESFYGVDLTEGQAADIFKKSLELSKQMTQNPSAQSTLQKELEKNKSKMLSMKPQTTNTSNNGKPPTPPTAVVTPMTPVKKSEIKNLFTLKYGNAFPHKTGQLEPAKTL